MGGAMGQADSERPTQVSGEYVIEGAVPSRPVPRVPTWAGFGVMGFETYVSRVVRDDVSLVVTPPSQAWAELLSDSDGEASRGSEEGQEAEAEALQLADGPDALRR
jgi:hypothetical protein